MEIKITAPQGGEIYAEVFENAARDAATLAASPLCNINVQYHYYYLAAMFYRDAANAFQAARGVTIGHNRAARYEAAADRLRALATSCVDLSAKAKLAKLERKAV